MTTKFIATLVFAGFFIIAIALTHAQPEPGAGTPPTSTGTTITITDSTTRTPPSTFGPGYHTGHPTCRPVGTCPPQSPRICARSQRGNCRRFENACQLERTNCATPPPVDNWRRTDSPQCKNIRAGATMARCAAVCPQPPSACAPPTPGQRLCISSRDRRQCCVVANKCQLSNLNCRLKPRGDWSVVNANLCHNMNVGEKAKSCFGRITVDAQ